ncbi:putative MFS transporter [Rosellinia necatrix]|uniref:Putative MFS transporter n=1 Tax=Rosellinia necatrix TaxID=77044 RepID=A0A1S8A7Q4_ROSNE|nr:putative MFS transporter [Rosellinia necatrix]
MASYSRQSSGGSGSSTAVIEMEPVYLSPASNNKSAEAISAPMTMLKTTTPPPLHDSSSRRRASSDEENQDGGSGPPPPTTAADVKERWNYPRSNIPRVTSCFYSFLVMGANDSAYGVSFAILLPLIKKGGGAGGDKNPVC